LAWRAAAGNDRYTAADAQLTESVLQRYFISYASEYLLPFCALWTSKLNEYTRETCLMHVTGYAPTQLSLPSLTNSTKSDKFESVRENTAEFFLLDTLHLALLATFESDPITLTEVPRDIIDVLFTLIQVCILTCTHNTLHAPP
jgi:hypothetical protein